MTKGRDRLGIVVELKVQYFRENFRIYLKLLRHFYGVQFRMCQMFQSAEEMFFYNS